MNFSKEGENGGYACKSAKLTLLDGNKSRYTKAELENVLKMKRK